jgi:hypothetical protein
MLSKFTVYRYWRSSHVHTSHSSAVTFQTARSPFVSSPRNHLTFLINFDPHMAASWVETQ